MCVCAYYFIAVACRNIFRNNDGLRSGGDGDIVASTIRINQSAEFNNNALLKKLTCHSSSTIFPPCAAAGTPFHRVPVTKFFYQPKQRSKQCVELRKAYNWN